MGVNLPLKLWKINWRWKNRS